MDITSTANEKIKALEKLIRSPKKRYEEGCYVVEGIRMFREIPPDRLREVYITEAAYEKFAEYVSDKENVYVVSDKVFKAVSDTSTPQGIIGVVEMKEYSLEDICNAENPFILIVSSLQDPGNMGTIVRTAEGAGVTGIIMSSDSVDIYNPKTVRSTMGSVFRVPVYISEKLAYDIDYLKAHNITIYGAHLEGEDFYNKDFTAAGAFLIGNEGNGLSDEISEKADSLIRIPMLGKVESLNAAISAAVISYEVLRQRKKLK